MKTVYLDKKERVVAWVTPFRAAMLSVAVLAFLFAPVWPAFLGGTFVLEPVRRSLIHVEVPGIVTEILAGEGKSVAAGEPILRLRNLELESAAGQANADLRSASARATQSSMSYKDFGPAERDRQQANARFRSVTEEAGHLQVVSPMQGTITTPKLDDLMGAYLKSGTEVAEVADLSVMTARVYIPEFGMRDVHLGALVRLHAESQFRPWSGTLTSLAPSPSVDATSLGTQNLEGIRQPKFYVGTVELQNWGDLREGLSGDAKILVGHRSVAGFAWRFARDLVGRRMW